jgi:hypothetical protein
MKKYLLSILSLIALSLFSNVYCYAQKMGNTDKALFAYIESGAGVGLMTTYNPCINFVYGKHMISYIGMAATRVAPDLPSDFVAGHFLGYNGVPPDQVFQANGLMYGRVIYTNSIYFRYVLRGGITQYNIQTPEKFIKQDPNNGLLTSNDNYSYTNTQKSGIGLILYPTLEIPISGAAGFSLGVYMQYTPELMLYGGNINILFGRLRHKTSYYKKKASK